MSQQITPKIFICENCKKKFVKKRDYWSLFCCYECEYAYMLKHHSDSEFVNFKLQ